MFLFANFCGTNAEVEVENHPVLSQIRIFVNPCFFASLCQRWSCGDEVHGEICQSGPLWSKITTDQQWFPINIFCCCNFDILFGEKKKLSCPLWFKITTAVHWSAVGSNKSLFIYFEIVLDNFLFNFDNNISKGTSSQNTKITNISRKVSEFFIFFTDVSNFKMQ